MKDCYYKYFKKTFFIISTFVIFYSAMSFNSLKKKECNSKELLSIGFDKLKNYSFVKDYAFSFKEKRKNKPTENLKQVITLNRGVKYKFFAVPNAEFEGKPVIEIFNNEKQEFQLATSYNQKFKRFYDEINFECKTTGNYCISFSFLDGMEGCAVGIMAFLE